MEEHIDGHEEGGDEEVWNKISSPILVFSSFAQERLDGQRSNGVVRSHTFFHHPEIFHFTPWFNFESFCGPDGD